MVIYCLKEKNITGSFSGVRFQRVAFDMIPVFTGDVQLYHHALTLILVLHLDVRLQMGGNLEISIIDKRFLHEEGRTNTSPFELLSIQSTINAQFGDFYQYF